METVDAETASWWLTANERNRELRVAHAEEITRAMQRGEWEISPDAIAFDTEGRLINGQHRLLAVARSGIAQTFVVVRGLASKSQETTDTGAKRHVADMLRLRGVPDAGTVASGTGYVWKYLRYGTMIPPVVPPTAQEIIATWERHPGILDSVRYIKQLSKRGPIGVSWAVALHYLFKQATGDDADTFFERLALGTELVDRDPILILRRQLERARARSSATYNPSVYAKVAWTIKAWNAWQEGLPLQQLSWRGGGQNPEPYPQAYGLDREIIDPVLAQMPEGPTPGVSARATVADLLGGKDG